MSDIEVVDIVFRPVLDEQGKQVVKAPNCGEYYQTGSGIFLCADSGCRRYPIYTRHEVPRKARTRRVITFTEVDEPCPDAWGAAWFLGEDQDVRHWLPYKCQTLSSISCAWLRREERVEVCDE